MQRLTKQQSHWVSAGVNTVTSTESNASPWQCDCRCYNPEQERFFDEGDDSWLWLVTSKTVSFLWNAISSFWK